ncbi:TrkH family potassium uptake protein [Mesomycoplasma conjunctivae]|uniref:TrkH family potassium uptake protein n=1 Tax=Mesomycoplasma conjunctivae TaxID=45361 RepID=UPI003DA36B22
MLKILKLLYSKIKTIQIIFFTYLTIILIGAGILSTPWARLPNAENIGFFKALFTSVSAFSDTGLSLVDTGTTFSVFGQIIIACLIFIGGIGFFAIKFFIFNYIFGFKLGIVSREILKIERSSNKISELKSVIKTTIYFFLIIIFVFSLILSIHFYSYEAPAHKFPINQNPYKNIGLSTRFGIFHTISALNNAGFDLVGGNSFEPYYSDYFLQTLFILLTVLGGIGYPVIYDFYIYFKNKVFTKKKKAFSFSLFTKISLISYFTILVISYTLFIIFEVTTKTKTFWNLNSSGNTFNKLFALLFHNFSTRSVGFSIFDVDTLTSPSLFLSAILMFIGSAPSSTGGGIRVTTFWILILAIIAKFRHLKEIYTFKRKISNERVSASAIVFVVSIILNLTLIFISSVSLDEINNLNQNNPAFRFEIHHIIFEVSSAFGTTGLSTGLIRFLPPVTQFCFMLIMVIGQLGVSSSVLVWRGTTIERSSHKYIEEDVIIG